MLRKWMGFLAACLAGMWLMASCSSPAPATPATPQFTLTVTKPTGGKISSSVGGINCGTSADVCTAKFNTGTKVTLTVVADSGKVFSGWANDCAASGTAASCEVTVNANKTVSANFATQQFTLTVTKPTGGKISTADSKINCGTSADVCTAKFDTGTKVTLTAVADSSKVFSGWANDCAASGTAASCEVTMGANKTVTASFLGFILRSAVQVMGTDGIAKNYSEFTLVNGKSLPVIYDILDSDGSQVSGATALSLCVSDSSFASITDISDTRFPRRFKVSVKIRGNFLIKAVAGSNCGGRMVASQEVSIAPLSKTVSLGGFHRSMALLADGTVKAWGGNSNGQLGLGNTTDKNTPQTVTGLSNVLQLSLGWEYSMALLADGTVKAWGGNSNGQLGLGNTTDKNTPQTVPGLENVLQLSAGGFHSMALLADGTVKVWGDNRFGQLGLGNTTDKSSPQTVPGLSNVLQLSAGGAHSMALLADGTVKAWGFNSFGQLGLGNTTNQNTPQTVPGLSNVLQLSLGSEYSMALLADGTVKAWGGNDVGQLGLGSIGNKNSPQTVTGLSNVLQLSAGNSHSMALLVGGTVKAWGRSSSGQLGLGNGAISSNKSSPQTVTGLSNVLQLSAGNSHSMAVVGGVPVTVQAWGFNSFGQLGLGNTTQQNSPQTITGL